MATTTSNGYQQSLYEKSTPKYENTLSGKPVNAILGPSDRYKLEDSFNPNSDLEWETRYWSAMELVNCLTRDKTKLKEEVEGLNSMVNSLKKALGDSIGKQL